LLQSRLRWQRRRFWLNSMTRHIIHVNEPYFTHLANESKKVEGRLNKDKFSEMNVGDELFVNDCLTLSIVGKKIYKTFREMIAKEGLNNVIPGAKSIDEAESVYYGFYTVKDESLFGVVAIEVVVVSKVL